MVVNKIGYPQRHPLVVSQLHVHLGRRTALLAADESRITRELDDVLGLGSTGQFGVERFVTPETEGRRLGCPFQKVCVAKPGRHDQSRLIDHLCAGPHRLSGLCGSLGKVEPFARNLDDANVPCLERGEVSLLVLDALLEDQHRRGIAFRKLYRIG